MNMLQLVAKQTRPRQSAGAYGYTEAKTGVSNVTSSAEEIVPFLVEHFHPRSVLDIGCGTGDWLAAFQRRGVVEVMGYDGPWVPEKGRLIAPESFRVINFYSDLPPAGQYDLAMCLEVAEHVEPAVGKKMVAYICQNSGLVLFSAAIPDQGGYEHINECFQEYWIRAFAEHGYLPFDIIRPAFWTNDAVSFWYKQNAFIFANEATQKKFGLKSVPFMASVVHPTLYDREVNIEGYRWQKSLAKIFKISYFLIRKLLRSLVGKGG